MIQPIFQPRLSNQRDRQPTILWVNMYDLNDNQIFLTLPNNKFLPETE